MHATLDLSNNIPKKEPSVSILIKRSSTDESTGIIPVLSERPLFVVLFWLFLFLVPRLISRFIILQIMALYGSGLVMTLRRLLLFLV